MFPAEYRRRRRRLLEAIGPDGVAVLMAAPERPRNRDVLHPYRQESDFYYLTGFPEPEAVLVLVPGRRSGEVVLFCRPYDEEKALWEGERIGPEGAKAEYGINEAHAIEAVHEELPKLLEDRRRIYYPLAVRPEWDLQVMEWLRAGRAKTRGGVGAPGELRTIDSLLHEQRLVKSPAELRLLRRAARLSAEAHKRVMRGCRPGLWEYELEAEFVHACATRGARFQAYPPIVGGGVNACVLHYGANDARLRDGDLVLIDAGCELDGYASDITRTFPVNGRFSAPQRELYELVLAAQQAAIAAAVPGNRWNQPHEAAVRTLTAGLRDLGLIGGAGKSLRQLLKEEAYKPYFMHRTGHWLGMDVHDVGDYQRDGQWRLLEPGMVLTIEPGIYVAKNQTEAPEVYRGIGIRIEDDVAITPEGHRILSAEAPKTVADIERWMRG